jgi:hypothetical protein
MQVDLFQVLQSDLRQTDQLRRVRGKVTSQIIGSFVDSGRLLIVSVAIERQFIPSEQVEQILLRKRAPLSGDGILQLPLICVQLLADDELRCSNPETTSGS